MTKEDEESGIIGQSTARGTGLTGKIEFHPAFYVGIWIFFSGSVILFNKWLLDTAGFRFPIFLTTWHLIFASLFTRILARTTTLLDGLKTVKMDGETYLRAIVPIGLFFSLSLICSNQAYLYLSVAFIQMLKATVPVAVLLTTWTMRIEKPNMRVLGNVSVIVLGVIISSYGEIAFVFVGFVFQACGIIFESIRLVMVQKLLSSPEYKMDPLVSLYYFAPICAAINAVCCVIFEGSKLSVQAILDTGLIMLFMNAAVAFCLNVAVVFLIGKTSSLTLTLSGVLKDILLVILSVIIWSTPITTLQMFGYTIALGGLIYYKIGGEQVRVAYMKFTGDESPIKRLRRSLWAKLVAGVLVLFVVLSMANALPSSGGIDTSSRKTKFTGFPGPQMVDAYRPATEGDAHGFEDAWEKMNNHPMLNTEIVFDPIPSTHPLDIVLFVSRKPDIETLKIFKEIFLQPTVSNLNPRLTVYGEVDSSFPVTKHIPLAKINSASAAYIDFIANHYDVLAEHTIFLDAEMDARYLPPTISVRFSKRTGVAELTRGGYWECECLECLDSSRILLDRVSEIYALTHQDTCSTSQKLLLSDDALFVASARRIRRNSRALYSHLRTALKENDTIFDETISRSWLFMLGCNDPTIASQCRGGEAEIEDCQCFD